MLNSCQKLSHVSWGYMGQLFVVYNPSQVGGGCDFYQVYIGADYDRGSSIEKPYTGLYKTD